MAVHRRHTRGMAGRRRPETGLLPCRIMGSARGRRTPRAGWCRLAEALTAMTETAVSVSPGLPVELGEIERQLGLLWEQTEAGKVRASLVNLVIYSEAPDAIEANTRLLARIAADHAFRALLVQACPDAAESSVHAWI